MSKNGFSYYKAETDRFQDIKIKRLKKRYACQGYAVYQYALNEIYRVEGCYLRFTEDQMFDCADYWDIPEPMVHEIIDYCAEIGLFHAETWQKRGILTARSIQSRYLDMCKVSKKKTYIPLDICLVEPEAVQVQPIPMPLFGQASREEAQAPAAQTREVQAVPSTQSPVVAPEVFHEHSGSFANTPENSGNIPEESDKEKKSKENPPSIPPGKSGVPPEEEARKLLRAFQEGKPPCTPPQKEPERNTAGLLYQLQRLNLTPAEVEEVLRLTGHGIIGHPVWGILNEIQTSRGIKTPRLFMLSRLRKAAAS